MRAPALLVPMLALQLAASDSTMAPSLPEGWTGGATILLMGAAEGAWRDNGPVLDDHLGYASLGAEAASPGGVADMLVATSVETGGDEGGGERMMLERLRTAVRWPGTPWVGAGVSYHDRAPFVPGMYDPVLDHGTIPVDSLRGATFSAGGFLGFDASYTLSLLGETDTLETLHVSSPWLGFAGADYRRVALEPGSVEDGSVLNSMTLRGDLRYVRPWVVLTGRSGEPGAWGVSAELRRFRPVSAGWGSLELVPGVAMSGSDYPEEAGDMGPGRRTLSLGLKLSSRRYMMGGGLLLSWDLESDSLTGIGGRGRMVSEAGVYYDLSGELGADGGGEGSLTVGRGGGRSSAEVTLGTWGDSLRVSGRASHVPRPDVCGTLEVGGDVDGSLDPSCSFTVTAFPGPLAALLSVSWEGSGVLLGGEVRASLR